MVPCPPRISLRSAVLLTLGGIAFALPGCTVIGDDAYEWRLGQDGGATDGGGDGGATDGGGDGGGGDAGTTDGGGGDAGTTDGGGGDAGTTDGGGGDAGTTDGGGGDGGGCETPWYRDADSDGYGDPGDVVFDCTAPAGYVGRAEDCDDARAGVNPGATETCATAYDDDCDTVTNERDAAACGSFWPDGDRDGYGDGSAQCWCSAPTGYASRAGDCDDGLAAVNPGATEVCSDGRDNDCDGEGCRLSGGASPSDADGSWSGSTSSYAGDFVAFLGDLDGDGLDDHGVGAYGWKSGSNAVGAVAIVLGDGAGSFSLSTGADARIVGSSTGGNFGRALAGLPDLDGDGYGELAVGAPSVTGGASTSGAVYLFHGPLSGSLGVADADRSLVGSSSNLYAGRALAALEDATGDGVADLLVGVVGDRTGGSGAGGAWLIPGPFSSGSTLEGVAVARLAGEASSDAAGRAVASAGDVDGDGLTDLLVNAYGNDTGGSSAGAAYLLLGGVSGSASLADADLRLYGAAANDRFGNALAGAGDVDGDGLIDLVVGADGQDAAGTDAGAVYVFLSPRTGSLSASSADARLLGEAADDGAGISVASAGDMDGDGRGDLLIGGADSDTAGTDGGAVWLVYGPISSGGLGTAAAWVLRGSSGGVGTWVAGGGDSNGDGVPDILVGASGVSSSAGAAYLFFGTGL